MHAGQVLPNGTRVVVTQEFPLSDGFLVPQGAIGTIDAERHQLGDGVNTAPSPPAGVRIRMDPIPNLKFTHINTMLNNFKPLAAQ